MTDRGHVRVEHGHKRVRTYLGGELVADTICPLLVWEIPYFPAYYIPAEDVRTELLTESGKTEHSPSRGEATYFNLKTDRAEAPNAAWRYPNSPFEELRGAIRIEWEAMDAWFEEDEQVYVHPRDPYSRVDVLRSSRHVEVGIGGTKVADSVRPVLLFETGLPVRYYLPKTDVRLELLSPSTTTTRCPYKGTAEYYSVTVDGRSYEDIVWWYRHPAQESAGIAGLVSFYNERVDITLDGVPLERPVTHFS
ncbi:MAG TPA: DUF427 domain-containing protein [Acidimicrobiales bacterium]|nr:DUF427 domain-containing protein [Acidimicrobiales bacterium]